MEESVLNEANQVVVRLRVRKEFSPAAPITRRDLFAGRYKQIDQTMGAVSQVGQHAILFGERGVGKTSLASVIHDIWSDIARDEESLLAPRVNCDSGDTFETIWLKVADEVQLLSEKRGVELAPQGSPLDDALSELTHGAATPAMIRRFFELSKAEFIVIVDEFDRVEDESVHRLMADTVKTLSDYLVDVTLVLVGVADTVDELISEHGSIDRALVQVLMPRMSPEELQEIVETRLKRVGMAIEPRVLRRISLLSQGLPHYTHLLGRNASTAAIEEGRMEILDQDVKLAVELAIEQAQETITNAYHRATRSPQRENLFRQVLLACAMANVDDLGYFAPADVRDPLSSTMGKKYEISAYMRHLHALCGHERGPLLQRQGEPRKLRFRFVNPLMKPYILFRGIKEGMVQEQMIF